MSPTRFLLPVLIASVAWSLGSPTTAPLRADEPAPFRSLGELNAEYGRRLLELERRRIADLSALAAGLSGLEADAAYTELFHAAVMRGLSADAEPAAGRCLASPKSGPEVRRLAHLVRVLAKADQGQHGQALARAKELMQPPGAGAQKADPDTALAVGEAYLQRLIREGRYNDARELCECACEAKDAPAALRDHFESRMGRLDLLGKAAPPVAGPDVDGKKVSLADMKGKVVLVDFWATWCPPCVASIPRLNALAEKYRERGFEILGVNVDAKHEDVGDAKTALMVVRRFLVSYNVTWTNLMNGDGPVDFAKAFGVEEIPANFLIDRDGKVTALELTDDALERAVAKALGDRPGGGK